MLRQEELDLLVVVTRSDQHARMTIEGLRAGVNVLVTKPWALNAGEGRRMAEAAASSGRLLLPWLPARWGCTLRRLQALLAENAVGRVAIARRAVTSFATRNDWQTQRRRGGGYLLNWGPHIVDPPLVLLRRPVARVYARMARLINPGDAEDLFLAILTLADGTVVQAEYTVAVEPLPDWFIQGDRGTIVVRDRRITVHRRTPERPDDPTAFSAMQAAGAPPDEESVPGALYGDEHEVYAEVADAVRGRRPFAVTPGHALELSRILDAIRRSAGRNRVVAVETDGGKGTQP